MKADSSAVPPGDGSNGGRDAAAELGSFSIGPDPEERGSWILRSALEVPRPLEEVFPFFGAPENLERLTPPWLRFEILTPSPIRMAEGTIIDYRLRMRGIPMRWRSRIDAWEPPHRFVDSQARGPYRKWIHEHRFERTASGTRIRDTVRYRVPFGRLVHRFFVRRDLERIFTYRRERMMDRFGPGES